MSQTVKSVIPGIIAGVINYAFIIPAISIAGAIYSSYLFIEKLSIVTIALILVAILLILKNQFFHQQEKDVRVIKTITAAETYLVRKNVARHIPDAETFDYLGELYGFHWGNVETIAHEDFNRQFSTDSKLPSILPHCQSFHERNTKQKNGANNSINHNIGG